MTLHEFLALANWTWAVKYVLALMLIGSLWGAFVGVKEGFIGALAYAGFGMLIGLAAAIMAMVWSLGIGFIILV